MLIRARFVVTMDGAPIENGAVVIAEDRIADVGTVEEVRQRHSGDVLDLGERVLLPGLINAHCHLDYTCLRGKISKQASFTDWIRQINAAKAELSPADYVRSLGEGFAEASRFGTTSIVNLTAFPELIPQFQEPPCRTTWCIELIDVRKPIAPGELAQMVMDLRKRKGPSLQLGLAPHAPYTASKQLYRACEKLGRGPGLPLTTHLAESREELSMFQEANGPLFDFLETIGRPSDDCGRKTPLANWLQVVESPESWLIAHFNEVTADDFELLQRTETGFDIVHCPRSHEFFGHSHFQVEKLRQLGFNICLGTDSLASNTDLNLFAEMRAFQQNNPRLSAMDLLSMVTTNAASAIGQPEALGCIRQNCWADLVAIRFNDSRKNLFDAVVDFDGEPWVMSAGKVIHPTSN